MVLTDQNPAPKEPQKEDCLSASRSAERLARELALNYYQGQLRERYSDTLKLKHKTMSDRIKGLTVTLRPDMRDDDAECVINAIRLLNGVVGVKSHVADISHHFAVSSAKHELIQKLRDILLG